MNGTNRLTGPRQRVLAAIQEKRSRHLDAGEIAAIVNRKSPAIHLATIYRSLLYLTRQGLVKRSSLNENHAHYEASRNDGVHLVCSTCGGVREVGDRQSKKLLARHGGLSSTLKERFTVSTWQMELVGTCGRCARQSGRPTTKAVE
ncbi:MAG: transcriptional repressor [Candidatus Edwardsbacteria bacterium]|nr:transcriptional repressor [Candidatus Edwardsbacteria bacterium]